MRRDVLYGIRRFRSTKITVAGPLADRSGHLVERQLTASAQEYLWLADITYSGTFAAWVYAAFDDGDVWCKRIKSAPTRT